MQCTLHDLLSRDRESCSCLEFKLQDRWMTGRHTSYRCPDCLYDEDVISEDAFYKWETSKDPAEQPGEGVALQSVTAFFNWLQE